jgi:signal peptidase I
VLFIAAMGLLLKVTDFAAVLLMAAVITGVIWLDRRQDLPQAPHLRCARARRGRHGARLLPGDRGGVPDPLLLGRALQDPVGFDEAHAARGRLHPGEQVRYGIRLPVVNKKVVEVDPIKRGDVVVFRYPADPSVDYIKRVVGLPGDRIAYRGKRISVNGSEVEVKGNGYYTDAELNFLRLPTFDEKLGEKTHQMMIVPAQPPVDLAQVRQFAHRSNCEYNDDGFSCTVPAGHYFMMGDNRDQSSDSRYWGFVPDDHIKGRAFLVWMNFNDFKRIGNGIQ